MRKILLLVFAMLFLPMVDGVKSTMATAQTAQWITAGDTIYTLDGRRANASTKGIVIQDGRKVVKK